jgi:hypothetical protein
MAFNFVLRITINSEAFWREVQLAKFLATQFSPSFCYLDPVTQNNLVPKPNLSFYFILKIATNNGYIFCGVVHIDTPVGCYSNFSCRIDVGTFRKKSTV